MIEAVIFDMDGLLIDSGPLWQEAEEIFVLKPFLSSKTLNIHQLPNRDIKAWVRRKVGGCYL